MIGIVRIALRRPYTFVVLALAILIIGPLAALRTPVDIFPDIRIPVVAIVWQYTGLEPADMAGRITTQSERALTTTVNDIEHIEAISYNGIGIVKVFFQPGDGGPLPAQAVDPMKNEYQPCVIIRVSSIHPRFH